MEFWDRLENIYPRDGLNYLVLRNNIITIRNLFEEYKYQINNNIKNYLTFLQQNNDFRVYYFLEGLKDSLSYSPNLSYTTKYYSTTEAEKLIDYLSIESRKQWTDVLYRSVISSRALLTVLAVYPRLQVAAGAYIAGALVLY